MYSCLVQDVHKTIATSSDPRFYCTASFQGYKRKFKKLLYEIRPKEANGYVRVGTQLLEATKNELLKGPRSGAELKEWCQAQKERILKL